MAFDEAPWPELMVIVMRPQIAPPILRAPGVPSLQQVRGRQKHLACAADPIIACAQWANTGVLVQGRFHALARLYFAARNPDEPETMESPQPPPLSLPPPMANGSALNEVLEAAAAANAIVM